MVRKNKKHSQQKKVRVGRFLFQISAIIILALVFYAIYLDGQIKQKFQLERYKAPALLYSQAFEIKPYAGISLSRVQEELKALDYQNRKYARQAGEYQVQTESLLIHRRGYEYAGQYIPAKRVLISFSEQQELTHIQTWPNQEPLENLTFEPHILGRFSTAQGEDRLLIGLEQIPALFIETLLLVEDREFYHHKGVRPTAIIRAALTNLMARRHVQGGSTLTQQLVKNMYLNHKKSYWRKLNEALMAVSLDYRFTKDEILEAYLNEVYFGQDRGHGIHGVALASQFYFGKPAESLAVNEIALLVGMIQGPSLYEPRRHPERAGRRRDTVLKLMYEHDLISQSQYLSAVESAVQARSTARLSKFDRPDFIDLVRKELPKVLPGMDWQGTGLSIYTTFDPLEQKRLEQAARASKAAQQLENIERALVLTEHQSGAVRALVGGKEPVHGGFNRAFEAYRPVGSLVKPWVYTLAFEQPDSFSLSTLVEDTPLELVNEKGQAWQPQNFDRKFRGPVSLYDSLAHSYNVPSVRIGLELTAQTVQKRLASLPTQKRIHPWPSLFLGAVEMNLLEVAAYYGALANLGTSIEPYSIEAITTHRGDLLYEHQATEVDLFDMRASWLTGFALEAAVHEGTARAIAHLGPGLAGKTGSTNDLRDSWFASYDAKYVLISWLGQDDNTPIGLTGSRGALPLAAAYWETAGVHVRAIQIPSKMHWAATDITTGRLVKENCPNARVLPYIGIPRHLDALGCSGEPEAVSVQEAQPANEQAEKQPWWKRIFKG